MKKKIFLGVVLSGLGSEMDGSLGGNHRGGGVC